MSHHAYKKNNHVYWDAPLAEEPNPGPSLILPIKEFLLVTGPGVYVIHDTKHVLYVGMAKNIAHRISSPEHSAVKQALKEATEVRLIQAWSEAHARDIESYYIRIYQPKYNKAGKYNQFQLECIFERNFREALLTNLGKLNLCTT